MKKTAAIISACMLTFALSACSGSNYVMHTNDGRTIVSDGTFPIRWRTTFKKQVEPVVIPASARVVMCFIVTMIWTSILYY